MVMVLGVTESNLMALRVRGLPPGPFCAPFHARALPKPLGDWGGLASAKEEAPSCGCPQNPRGTQNAPPRAPIRPRPSFSSRGGGLLATPSSCWPCCRGGSGCQCYCGCCCRLLLRLLLWLLL